MFLFIFCIIWILILVMFANLHIRLEFENFEFCIPKSENTKAKENFTNKKSKVFLKIFCFNLIPIFKINLNKYADKKPSFVKLSRILKNVNFKRKSGNIKFKEILKILKINLKKFELRADFGLEDAMKTAMIIGASYTIIANIIRNNLQKCEEAKYDIRPIYGKNILYIFFNGIFEIKAWNIINVIWYLKRRKDNGRTSNKRTYVYSNE